MSQAQKWARKRNFSKFRLKGLEAQLKNFLLSDSVLTSTEEDKIKQAQRAIEDLLHWWKEQTPTSKKMYVKEVS